jgi:hypothetical protein
MKQPCTSLYCWRHRCLFYIEGGDRCSEQILDIAPKGAKNYQYCAQHCCEQGFVINGENIRCRSVKAVLPGGTNLCAQCTPQPEILLPLLPPPAVCIVCTNTASEGIACRGEEAHFLCCNCFSEWVIGRCQPENVLRLQQRNWIVYCRKDVDGCEAQHPAMERGFCLQDIAMHATGEAVQAYVRAREVRGVWGRVGLEGVTVCNCLA